MSPDEQPWGTSAQTRKRLNVLISSRPHSLEEVTSNKMKLLCFLLETIRNYTELQTPLEHGIQHPGQTICYAHFHPHTQDWFCEEALLGFQKFAVTSGHTCKSSLHALFLAGASTQLVFILDSFKG